MGEPPQRDEQILLAVASELADMARDTEDPHDREHLRQRAAQLNALATKAIRQSGEHPLDDPKRLQAWILTALAELAADVRERGGDYLPVDCPLCGRHRLEWCERGDWRCEKCGCTRVALGGAAVPPEPEPLNEGLEAAMRSASRPPDDDRG